MVTTNPMPTINTSAMAHSRDTGKPGRSSRWIPHASHSAFCIAPATLRTPNSSTRMPNSSGKPVALIEPRSALICVPITGYWASAELNRSSCSRGLFLSTMFSTVLMMSSRGKIARNA